MQNRSLKGRGGKNTSFSWKQYVIQVSNAWITLHVYVRAAFVLCVYNLICGSTLWFLVCENSFHCEENSIGSRDPWVLQHVCIRGVVLKDGHVVMLHASPLRLWVWSVKGFMVKAVLFHIFDKTYLFQGPKLQQKIFVFFKQIHETGISVPLSAFWLTVL